MMSLPDPRSEMTKARIRVRYGTLLAFERELGLPPRSVSDVLRGRSNARVQAAIDQVLSPSDSKSANVDDSSASPIAHRLYEGAK